MTKPLNPSSVPAIKSALKFFRVTSYITGIVLILVMILWGVRRLAGYELMALTSNGLITLEPYGVDGLGLPEGINLTVGILVVHGWLYVAYLFGDFRLWTLLRWSFFRFLLIASGGIVPFLSFFTERHYTKVAQQQLDASEVRD
jgi:integral membrane protein